ncbi:hypothetical protein E4T56_gene12958 [Termitomyces sp. T112]|nr:hypothetical protein E4T56_gene12958 [Termitomyces sp. T112]
MSNGRFPTTLQLGHEELLAHALTAGVTKYDAMARDHVLGVPKRGLVQINVLTDVIPVDGRVFDAARSESPTLAAARPMRANGSERAKLACTNCRRDNKKCDDQRPCARCAKDVEKTANVAKMSDRAPIVSNPVNHVLRNLGKAEDMVLELKRLVRDKIRCDGVRPCASCVRKGLECIERACKNCSREGRAAECTHRKAQAAAMAEAAEAQNHQPNEYRPLSADKEYYSQQRLHLPPISHPSPYPSPSPHGMYSPTSPMNNLGPASHYYYPQQSMIGPGQPPQPIMQPYIQHPQSDQRIAYYPAIDPNIDKELPAGGSGTFPLNTNDGQANAGPSASASTSR